MKEMVELPVFKYHIKNTGYGSDRYGPCEVCGDHADTIYAQIEERAYLHPDGHIGFTVHKCNNLFGHKDCLISKRRNEVVS